MITQQQLEAHLWRAADILRGAIDSSDYKNYIFGFLFLKRLSDVFEEEAQKIEEELGDHDLAWNEPDEHTFFVPKEARWSTLRTLTQDIGQRLNEATEKLEDFNPNLEGILVGIDFNDERKLGGPKQKDTILGQLILRFSELNLRNDNLLDPNDPSLSPPDILGRAYEYLIERFADDAGKNSGEFYTPKKVVELLVRVLDPEEGQRICDPTCGSGGMLIESYYHIKHRKQGNPRNISLFGQEKNLGTWAIAQMNMLLHNILDFDLRKGDTIREPQLVQGGELMLFDIVIANPPFSLDNWGQDVAKEDGYKRFEFGLPPKSRGDFGFIEHMITTLNDKGRAGVVVPHGVLFRSGSEGTIRKNLIEGDEKKRLPGDLIEAVIGLPQNLFYGTGIPGAIVIFNRAKPAERQGKILFIDASREYEEGKNQNHLCDNNIEHAVQVYRAFQDEEKYAKVVDLAEIRENDHNLNISRYVITIEPEEMVDLELEIQKLREVEQKRAEAERIMDEHLRALGFKL